MLFIISSYYIVITNSNIYKVRNHRKSMKNGLIRRIGAGLVGATALITANCASLNPGMRELEVQYREMDRVKRVLNVKNDLSLDRNLRNGYYATLSGGMDLRTIAGIMSGTIKVRKTEDGYKGEGIFSQYLQQEALDRACETADTNYDNIVTNKEARDSLLDTYRTATENWVNR